MLITRIQLFTLAVDRQSHKQQRLVVREGLMEQMIFGMMLRGEFELTMLLVAPSIPNARVHENGRLE